MEENSLSKNKFGFQRIRPEDKLVFDTFYEHKTIQNCETAFANLCGWGFLLGGEYAIINGALVTRVHQVANKEICYHCPIGDVDKVELIRLIIEDSIENNYTMRIILDCKEVIQVHYKDAFDIEDKREYYDYVYLRESLATLRGKKLQPKRNHCNKFTKSYNYIYRELNSKSVKECVEFSKAWLDNKLAEEPDGDLEGYVNELRVIEYFAENFDALGMVGGAIYVDRELVAFTMGSKVNNDTFCTHIEKANTDYDGAYAMINREFAKHLPEEYVYINREEDLGIEGLRRAKLSYQPIKLIEKEMATYIRD